ncbi:Gldg family protein [Thermodesulfobacteriota bacterium]
MAVGRISAKYIKPLIYLLVVVLINLVGMTLFFRLDLTQNNIYSISAASKKVVATLTEPLTVNVFFTKNLPAPHNNTERYLHDLLEEYAIYANQYFNYRFYDVSPETEGIKGETKENRELADNYGIHPIQIQVIEKDEVKFKKAYMGLVMIHGDMIERIPTVTSIKGLEYKLTTTMQKLNNKVSALLRLEDNIKVKLFLSSSLMEVAPLLGLKQLQNYPAKLKEVVEEINPKFYGRLEYSYLDPSDDQSLKNEVLEYNLVTLKWPELPNKGIQAGNGAIGIIMEYGDKFREIQLLKVFRIPIIGTQYNLADIEQIEEMINSNLETLIDINEHLGYLADHGTFSVSRFAPPGQEAPEALTNFSELISENYTIKQVNLKDGVIPADINCMVFVRPTEKFSEYELYQIDQALMRGKNIAFILDAFNEVISQNQQFSRGPTYIPLNTGLEKLLEHYGIRIKQSLVMDENCHKQRLPLSMGGGERPFYFAPIIKSEFINQDLAYMKNIKGLIAVKVSPLELDDNRLKENNITAHRLFASSEKSWEMSKRINLNPLLIKPPKAEEERESFPLAYMLEGQFPSYFEGKPLPEKTAGSDASKEMNPQENAEKKTANETGIDLSRVEDTGGFIAKGRKSKIFIMASSEMLKDNILDKEGENPNAMFIMNIVDALNQRSGIAMMRSKVQQFNPLSDSSALTKTFIKTFNIVGLPVLIVMLGLIMWLLRHARKKRIQMMFS